MLLNESIVKPYNDLFPSEYNLEEKVFLSNIIYNTNGNCVPSWGIDTKFINSVILEWWKILRPLSKCVAFQSTGSTAGTIHYLPDNKLTIEELYVITKQFNVKLEKSYKIEFLDSPSKDLFAYRKARNLAFQVADEIIKKIIASIFLYQKKEEIFDINEARCLLANPYDEIKTIKPISKSAHVPMGKIIGFFDEENIYKRSIHSHCYSPIYKISNQFWCFYGTHRIKNNYKIMSLFPAGDNK